MENKIIIIKDKQIHHDMYKLLVNKIREKRKSLGLKQDVFSKMLGRDEKYISRIEQFDRDLNMLETWELCQNLEIDFVELMRQFDTNMKRSIIDV